MKLVQKLLIITKQKLKSSLEDEINTKKLENCLFFVLKYSSSSPFTSHSAGFCLSYLNRSKNRSIIHAVNKKTCLFLDSHELQKTRIRKRASIKIKMRNARGTFFFFLFFFFFYNRCRLPSAAEANATKKLMFR